MLQNICQIGFDNTNEFLNTHITMETLQFFWTLPGQISNLLYFFFLFVICPRTLHLHSFVILATQPTAALCCRLLIFSSRVFNVNLKQPLVLHLHHNHILAFFLRWNVQLSSFIISGVYFIDDKWAFHSFMASSNLSWSTEVSSIHISSSTLIY